MNAPDTQKTVLRLHAATIESRFPIMILGSLPRGAAAHVVADDALDLLADQRDGLSYFAIAQAEIDLGELIGRPVGIVMLSELGRREADEVSKVVRPL